MNKVSNVWGKLSNDSLNITCVWIYKLIKPLCKLSYVSLCIGPTSTNDKWVI
jgi:hypothetical protein